MQFNRTTVAIHAAFIGLTSVPSSYAADRTAQAPSAQTTLPTIEVAGERQPESPTGPVNGFAAQRTETGAKIDTPLVEMAQSISVVGREELDARGGTNDVMDALRYTPGIAVSVWGVDNRGRDWALMRGFPTINTTHYRDGLNRGGDGRPLTEMYGMERIEVLRGPSSVLYGSGDAGGIINRISKRPTGDTIREVEMQAGSFDRRRLAFDLGDRLNKDGTLSFRLVGLGLKTNSNNDKYPDGTPVKNERFYLAPSIRWQPSAATSVVVLADIIDNKSGDDFGYLTTNSGALLSAKEGDPKFSWIKQRQSTIGYQLEHRLDENWKVRQNFRQEMNTGSKRHIRSKLLSDERTLRRTAQLNEDPFNQTVVDTNISGSFKNQWFENKVLAGLDWNRFTSSGREFTGDAPSLDVLAPVYGVPIAEPTTLNDNYRLRTSQLGAYLNNQIRVSERWIYDFGGRYDRVNSNSQSFSGNTNTTHRDRVFSARGSVTYMIRQNLSTYVSYGESFLPNSGFDAAGRAFAATQGKQVEVGAKFSPAGSNTLLTAAVFDLRKSNVVTTDVSTNEDRQIGKQRSRGIELEAKADLTKQLSATASYTYLDMKVRQSGDPSEIGKTPVIVPNQMASLWTDYRFATGLSVGGGVRHIGKRWNNSENTSREPSVTLLDAAIRYRTGSWLMAVNANNLLNRKYNATRVYDSVYLGPVRSIDFTLRYRF